MKLKMKNTWVVVADGASAQFFVLHEHGTSRSIEHVAETMASGISRHARDLKSDKPGRSFTSAGGTTRSSVEPHHDYHKLEKHDFARAVAAFLEHAFGEHKFERLVLVAPSRSLGELRSILPDKVKAAVWREVSKDVTKLGLQDLWARIAPALEEGAPPAGV